MNKAIVDNSADVDLKKTITWQFDNATRLVGVIEMFKDFFNQSTKNLWNAITGGINIVDVEEANPYYLAIWGKILGVKRPVLSYDSAPLQRTLSSELYRKVLIGRFRLVNADASLDSYLTFVKFVFGNNVRVIYGSDMSIGFEFTKTGTLTPEEDEQKRLVEQKPDVVFAYPAGVKSTARTEESVLGFAEQAEYEVNVEAGDFTIGNFSGSSFSWKRKAR